MFLPLSQALLTWMLGAGIYMITVLTYETLSRRKQHSKIAMAMNHFVKTNELILKKLSALPEFSSPSKETADGKTSSEIVAEIKILQTLMEKIAAVQKDKYPEEREVSDVSESAEKEKEKGEKKIDVNKYERREVLSLLQDAIKNDRIEMLLQPIVSLPQRKPRFFECFSRIRTQNGTILLPDHYLDVATEESLVRLIDNTLLFRSIQVIRHGLRKKIHVPVFCNLSIATLQDAFFVDSFIDFIGDHPELSKHIVFEMNAERFINKLDAINDHLEELNHFGCYFSLDGIENIELDLPSLKKKYIRFIKLDAPFLLNFTRLEGDFQRLLSLKDQADLLGIDLILSKVETDKQLLDLSDLHLDFGQGYLFGEPKLNTRI